MEVANDFDKVKANMSGVQAPDKDLEKPVWSVRVLDAVPAARTAELKSRSSAKRLPLCRTSCREPRCAQWSSRSWPWCLT